MDKEYLNKLVYSSGEKLRSTLPAGIEPQGHFENITAEKLGQGIQKFLNACARKTGIEKALAVRRGVEKIYYSKDTITVRFKCVSDSDGKPGDSSLDAAASPCPPPTVCSPARKTERPVSKLETGPTLKLERLKKVELIGIEPTTSSLRTTRSPS